MPRAIVTGDSLEARHQELVEARATLLGLWGDKDAVHLALIEDRPARSASSPTNAATASFPSVAALHPAAGRLERAIGDLFGLKACRLARRRTWLDLGSLGRDPSAWQGQESRGRRPRLRLPAAEGKISIRFRSGRSMPASSSPGISASPPMARPWRGSNSVSAMCIRASKG